MQPARRHFFDNQSDAVTVTHADPASPRRAEAESFIRQVFARHHAADVTSFAPNLVLFERRQQIVAACGWRPAASEKLFLECYLEQPIEHAMTGLAQQPVRRDEIVEVGNLAADKPGGTIQVVLALTAHLDRLGYKWLTFTATRELIAILNRLGLPALALAPADPQRLGEAAAAWGSYYSQQPVVVAGRIRTALARVGRRA